MMREGTGPRHMIGKADHRPAPVWGRGRAYLCATVPFGAVTGRSNARARGVLQ